MSGSPLFSRGGALPRGCLASAARQTVCGLDYSAAVSRVGNFSKQGLDVPYDGVTRAVADGEQATLVSYTFEPGAAFPIHHHPEEQITLVIEGDVEFTVDGEPRRMQAGDWIVVQPGVEHGLRAGGRGARVLGVISPARAARDAYVVPGFS